MSERPYKSTPIKINSREQLMTLPPGLYELPETKSVTALYVAITDELVDGEVKLLARVRPPGLQLPTGIEEITVRPDGGVVLFGWHVIEGTERNQRPARANS